MSDRAYTILLVDDEVNILKSLRRLLNGTGYHVLTSDSGENALKLFNTEHVDLVISDYRMPGMNGIELLRTVRERYPDVIRIILSGYADVATVVEAINDGQVYRFISKPWNDQELYTTVLQAIEQKQLAEENARLAEEIRARNAELEELTRLQEEKVRERTMALETRNRALRTAHNILDHLPTAVVGIDRDDYLVYANRLAIALLPHDKLRLGYSARSVFGDDVVNEILKSLEEGCPRKLVVHGASGKTILCAALPDKAGVVCLFALEWSCPDRRGSKDSQTDPTEASTVTSYWADPPEVETVYV
jgi:two-component system NtrC family sensor kinase